MLKNQETNHEELMKQLSTLGDTVNNAITGTNYTTATGISDPFTPAGSNIPQQTKITIDNKGNITSSTIPRPDLSPNSTQAPTRSEIIKKNTETSTSENPSTTTGTTTGTQQGSSQQQQQNFCEQNPKSAACAELGNDDYEDLNIPEQAIDLKIEPLNTFQSTGVCPAPKQFDLGILGRFEIGYDALCDVASRLRPIFILITVVSCSFFVYGAIKEL